MAPGITGGVGDRPTLQFCLGELAPLRTDAVQTQFELEISQEQNYYKCVRRDSHHVPPSKAYSDTAIITFLPLMTRRLLLLFPTEQTGWHASLGMIY